MGNLNFDKNGLDSSEVHWLQCASFVLTEFAIYFGWEFSIMLFSTISLKKKLSFGIVMDITP